MTWDLHSGPEAPHPDLQPSEPGGRWWWVSDEGQLSAALYALPRLGLTRARYSFHLGRVVHAAAELGLHQVRRTLQLGHDATGEAEIGSLHDAGAPHEALQALLAAALADLATQREGGLVVVELPAERDAADANGRSPFWDGLVRHFAAGAEPRQLAQRFGPAFTSHLGALLPRQSIHAAFLPEATQLQLGQPAPTRWLAVLRDAGFADWQHCRIDDGGPIWAKSLAP